MKESQECIHAYVQHGEEEETEPVLFLASSLLGGHLGEGLVKEKTDAWAASAELDACQEIDGLLLLDNREETDRERTRHTTTAQHETQRQQVGKE